MEEPLVSSGVPPKSCKRDAISNQHPATTRSYCQRVPMEKSTRASAFGRLLNEASKQVIEEEDSRFASELNAKEEKWRIRQRQREDKAGAKLALQLSEEEYGRVKAQPHPFRRDDQGKENRRQDRFDADALDDFEVALRLAEEERNCLAKSSRRNAQIIETDQKVALELQERLRYEVDNEWEEALRNDAEYAMLIENGFVRERREQESKDEALARRMSNLMAREEHRLQTAERIAKDAEKAGKTWAAAEVGVEDVAGGICLYTCLPGASDITVRCEGQCTVTIDACRVSAKGAIRFSADVQLEGVAINESDLSFEYASDNGILYAYVEGVHLKISTPLVLSDLPEKLAKGFRRLLGIRT